MEHKVVNLLVAISFGNGVELSAEQIKEVLEPLKEKDDNIEIGKVLFARDKDSITKALKEQPVDVVICGEQLSGEAIGAGTINTWRKTSPHAHIILVMADQKRNKEKFWSLVKKQYYNMIYQSEFGTHELINLMINPRDLRELIEHYELQDMSELLDNAPEAAEILGALKQEDDIERFLDGEELEEEEKLPERSSEDDAIHHLMGEEIEDVEDDVDESDDDSLRDIGDVGDIMGNLNGFEDVEETTEESEYHMQQEYTNNTYSVSYGAREDGFKPSIYSGNGYILNMVGPKTIIWESSEKSTFPDIHGLAGSRCHMLLPYMSATDSNVSANKDVMLPAMKSSFKPALVPVKGTIVDCFNTTALLIDLDLDISAVLPYMVGSNVVLVRNP